MTRDFPGEGLGIPLHTFTGFLTSLLPLNSIMSSALLHDMCQFMGKELLATVGSMLILSPSENNIPPDCVSKSMYIECRFGCAQIRVHSYLIEVISKPWF